MKTPSFAGNLIKTKENCVSIIWAGESTKVPKYPQNSKY
jgi:hypothetical protein